MRKKILWKFHFNQILHKINNKSIFHCSFIHQRNSRTTASVALNDSLSAVNIEMANCTLVNAAASNYGLNVGSRIISNYPCYTIDQPLLVNYYASRVPIQPQYPAIYYYFPSVSNLYQNQYVLINNEHQPFLNGNIQVSNLDTSADNMHSNDMAHGPVSREIYEKYNISFNDAL